MKDLCKLFSYIVSKHWHQNAFVTGFSFALVRTWKGFLKPLRGRAVLNAWTWPLIYTTEKATVGISDYRSCLYAVVLNMYLRSVGGSQGSLSPAFCIPKNNTMLISDIRLTPHMRMEAVRHPKRLYPTTSQHRRQRVEFSLPWKPETS